MKNKLFSVLFMCSALLLSGCGGEDSDNVGGGSDNTSALDVATQDRKNLLSLIQKKNHTQEDITAIEEFDTSNINDMSNLFAHSLLDIDLSQWKTEQVINMEGMFYGAVWFNQDLSGWDVSNVLSMKNMFVGAKDFNQDLSGWDVSNVIDDSSMLSDTRIQVVHLPNTKNKAFYEALIEKDYDVVANYDVSLMTSMAAIFYGASAFNQDISEWNTGNVTDMSMMFNGASAFNQDISKWNTGNVTNMSTMFSFASTFNQDISTWNVGRVVEHRNFSLGTNLVFIQNKQPKFKAFN